MSRIAKRFAQLRAQNRAALIPFLTPGVPTLAASVPLLHDMVAAGADLVEVALPFSDPMADGPVIQRASERALAQGTYTEQVMAVVGEFREQDTTTPVILMGYLNPIEAMGYAEFARAAAKAGIDGCIIVDLPPEEGQEFRAELARVSIDQVFLVAPTTTPERAELICKAASGFIYYVSLRGVTGAGNLDLAEVRERLASLKRRTELPAGVGFGINNAQSAAQVAEFADAVIVGSAVMRLVEECDDNVPQARDAVKSFIGELAHAVRGARQRAATGS
jgi:tryptophan synthase alpha chain